MRFNLPFRGLRRPSSNFVRQKTKNRVQATFLAQEEAKKVAAGFGQPYSVSDVRAACVEAATQLNNPSVSESMIWIYTRTILRNRKDV